MTKKQYNFAVNYCKGMSGTQAAIKAGYKEKSAYSMASENLKKPEIKAIIDRLNKETEDKDIADIKEIKIILTKILRGELQEEEIVVKQNSTTGQNKANKVKKSAAIKDRIKAGELLGKTYQMFTDNVKVENEVIILTGEDELEE